MRIKSETLCNYSWYFERCRCFWCWWKNYMFSWL